MEARVTSFGGPAPTPAGAYDLAALGYVEEEFILEGQASSFAIQGERTADGQWRAAPAETAPFVTRLVTRRPVDAERFSGAVMVEWNNVSGGVDASPDWTLLHRQLIRAGHAWMGVTAQKAGVDGGGFVEGPHLKKAFPERYGALDHPGDAWSYDIFSQSGAALQPTDRTARPAGGKTPDRHRRIHSRRCSWSATSTPSIRWRRSTMASSCMAAARRAPASTACAAGRASPKPPASAFARTLASRCWCCRARPT